MIYAFLNNFKFYKIRCKYKKVYVEYGVRVNYLRCMGFCNLSIIVNNNWNFRR